MNANPKTKPLTPKQQRFVEEYLKDLNATQAAIRAGYSSCSAYAIGSRLLKNVAVLPAIIAGRARISEKCELTQEKVIRDLMDVAERCRQAVPVERYDRAQKRIVPMTDAEGRAIYEFDSAGANRALELLGRHLGMFGDKVEHSGSLMTGLVSDERCDEILTNLGYKRK